MPRQSIDLTKFNVGLVTNPDQEDIPLEAQNAGSQNIDVLTQGKLKGVPKPLSASLYGYDGQTFGWINRSDGKWDLIYSDNSTIRVIYDFYGTQTTATLTGVKAQVIIPNNQEVHVGFGAMTAPKWIGYVSHGQFGGVAPSTLQVVDAPPAQPSSSNTIVWQSATASTEENATFIKGFQYHYMFSFTYDGYQESPLCKPISSLTGIYQVTTDINAITLRITIASFASLNKRITGVKVYRRERPFFDSAQYTDYQTFLDITSKLPYNLRPQRKKGFKYVMSHMEDARYISGSFGSFGEFQLIQDIDINDTAWTTSSVNKIYDVVDTNTNVRSGYYAQTGIDESLTVSGTSYGAQYALATVVNNYLIVGDVTHSDIPETDASHTLLRSMPYRYDTFDIYNDRLILPTKPTAMKAHRGKLYVWDENTTYIIDPISFQIEKVITGRGCSSQKSVVETDYGLFWANKNGVYWSTQTEELIQPTKDNLTEPILSTYQTAVAVATPILTYNSGRNQLLVHIYDDIYAYNTVERRWDFYPDYKLVSQEEVCGAFIGKNGETYTVTDNDLYKDFADTNRKPWIYITKEFTLDDPSQEKKFYKIIRDSVGTFLWKYSLNGGTTWITFSSEDLSILRGKSIMLYVSGLDTTSTVDSISILCRRLEGKR